MAYVVVVGGGISGAFVAYFLARRGARVVIIDPGSDSYRASDNNPGGINPLHGPGIPGPMSALALYSYRMHREEWPRIEALSGVSFKPRDTSRLCVAFTESEVERLLRARQLYSCTARFGARWLDREELQRQDPRISPKALGGLLASGNAMVDGREYCRAVIAAARAIGADYRIEWVTAVDLSDRRVEAVRTNSGRIPVDAVVFATGPRVEEVSSVSDLPIPVRPVRGELLLARFGPDTPRHDITWSRFGVYHHVGDSFWLGGTMEEAGMDAAPTACGKERVLQGVSTILPSLRSSSRSRPRIVRHTAGLRPMTPDGMPITGQVPGCRNAWMTLGAGVKGVLLSSGLGRATAAMVAGDVPGMDLSFLGPERFSGTPAGKRPDAGAGTRVPR